MSRGYGERRAAWEVWSHLHTIDDLKPVAFEHHCGALTPIMEFDDLGLMVCSGCGHELARPESECTPLYRLERRVPVPEEPRCTCIEVHGYQVNEPTLVRSDLFPCPLHPESSDG